MHDLKWSPSEKKLARQVFEQALELELNEILVEFKHRAATASTAEEMWAVRAFLAAKQREIDDKYDFRYSRLILLFSRLVREGRIRREQLDGLSDEKLSFVERVLSL
jgi:hypothetical protein